MSKHLYFMRHGDISIIKDSSMTVAEASEQISLSLNGLEQVINADIPKDLEIIVISPSLRTRQTANLITQAHMLTVPIVEDNRLHPWNSGTDNWEEYWNRYFSFHKHRDEPNFSAEYETKQELISRLQPVIDDYKNKNTLIIAHSVLLATYLNKRQLKPAEIIQVY